MCSCHLVEREIKCRVLPRRRRTHLAEILRILVIARLGLPEDRAFNDLSGGLKRRCLLARALAAKPGLLLLDEPTNHLDLDSILWMEEFLLEEKIPLLFVTHDRAFLHRMANRII